MIISCRNVFVARDCHWRWSCTLNTQLFHTIVIFLDELGTGVPVNVFLDPQSHQPWWWPGLPWGSEGEFGNSSFHSSAKCTHTAACLWFYNHLFHKYAYCNEWLYYCTVYIYHINAFIVSVVRLLWRIRLKRCHWRSLTLPQRARPLL